MSLRGASIGASVLVLGGALLVATAPTSTAVATAGRGLPHVQFGADGVVQTGFDSLGHVSADSGKAIAIQSDGKVIVVGRSGDNDFSTMAIARYLPGGGLDGTFGVGGKREVAFQDGPHAQANAVKVDSDGRVIVAGVVSGSSSLTGTGSKIALVRLTPRGVVDDTFGVGGRVVTDVGAGGGGANGLFVLPNGKPIVAGYGAAGPGADYKGKVIRYTASGTRDISFGLAGVRTLSFAGRNWVWVNAMDVDPSGRIFVGGFTTIGADRYGMVGRLTSDGDIDAGFHGDGYREINYNGTGDSVRSVVVVNDDRILVGGSYIVNAQSYSFVIRMLTIGAVDLNYGSGGTTYVGLPGFSLAAMASRSNGTVVSGSFNDDQVLAWIRPDGGLNTNFGANGYSRANLPGTAAGAGVAFTAAGTALGAGTRHVVTDDFLITAWNGVATPAPAAPIIRTVVASDGSIRVGFGPGVGGGPVARVAYQYERLNARGAAQPISPVNVVAANTRQLVIPRAANFPGLRVRVRGVGPYSAGPNAVTLWQQQSTGRVANCTLIRPTSIRFDGNRAVIRFPQRGTGCGSWRFGPRFVAIPRGSTQVVTPPLALSRAYLVVFRANNALNVVKVRRG